MADRLQLNPRSIRRLIDAGELPVFRLGRAVRIAEADLERYLQRARRL